MQHGTAIEGEDARFMRRALELAERAYGLTAPNPQVGAVVVRAGVVLGEGWHERAGLAHAEPQALEMAREAGAAHRERDWILYVNMEPCTHHGQTPPCVDAILRAPVKRVVVAMVDPDPRVDGGGIETLRRHGVQVDVGCLLAEAEELNHAFAARQRRNRPFVALKVALSADDCIAGAQGAPVRITGEAAQRHTHRLRAGCQAVLVGAETLARDRPRLDRRMYDGPGQVPRRLVFDPRLRSRPEWFTSGPEPWWVFAAGSSQEGESWSRLQGGSVEVLRLPRNGKKFDLQAFVDWMRESRIWSVLVEGGGATHAAFLEAGLWDRMYEYRNPSLRLDGTPWSARDAWQVEQCNALQRRKQKLGNDTLVVYDHRRSIESGES